MVKPTTYRGLYLIGEKAASRILAIQVVDRSGDTVSFPLHEYVARGIEPNYETLPWRQDIKISRAQPKSEEA